MTKKQLLEKTETIQDLVSAMEPQDVGDQYIQSAVEKKLEDLEENIRSYNTPGS